MPYLFALSNLVCYFRFRQANPLSSCQREKGNYLSAIGCFGLEVIEGDEFSEQTALLVAPLHSAELKVCLWLEEDELQVDGKAGHVDGKWPMGVKHCLPAVDLPGCIHLGGLVPQPPHKSHRPHRNFPS